MKNKRLLYLVQHTNKEMFKIGIATTNHRFHDLNRDYEIDWSSSRYFTGEDEDITKLERILHNLFHKKRLDKQNGTGGTEWFSSECLNEVVEAILFNTNNSNLDICLEPQGILLNTKEEKEKIHKWKELDNLEFSQEITDKMNVLIPELQMFAKPTSFNVCSMFSGYALNRNNQNIELEKELLDCILSNARELVDSEEVTTEVIKFYVDLQKITSILIKYNTNTITDHLSNIRYDNDVFLKFSVSVNNNQEIQNIAVVVDKEKLCTQYFQPF